MEKKRERDRERERMCVCVIHQRRVQETERPYYLRLLNAALWHQNFRGESIKTLHINVERDELIWQLVVAQLFLMFIYFEREGEGARVCMCTHVCTSWGGAERERESQAASAEPEPNLGLNPWTMRSWLDPLDVQPIEPPRHRSCSLLIFERIDFYIRENSNCSHKVLFQVFGIKSIPRAVCFPCNMCSWTYW